MKKVVSITLAGLVFSIEEDAFSVLQVYLDEIKNYFRKSGDQDEISDDIESSIAEKLTNLGRNERTAVTLLDIENIKRELGEVSDMASSEPESMEADDNKEESKSTRKGKVYRDPDNKIIAGIASGISAYFDIDPIFLRIVFLLLIFAHGAGVWLYLVLWFIIPQAKTVSQKLEMRGSPVNLTSIRDNVEETIDEFKKKDKTRFKKIASFPVLLIRYLVKFIGKIFATLIPILRVLIGIVFTVAGASLVAAIVSVITAVLTGNILGNLDPVSRIVVDQLTINPVLGTIAIISIFIIVAFPAIVLISAGASLISKRVVISVNGFITGFAFWIIAIGIAVSAGVVHGPAIEDEIIKNKSYISEYYRNGNLFNIRDEAINSFD